MRVECVKSYYPVTKGDIGTCLEDENKCTGIIPVKWDRNFSPMGHTCAGQCAKGHGWNVLPEHIKLIENEMIDISEMM